MTSGFSFQKIVIVQSLEPHETKTGEQLYDYIKNNTNQYFNAGDIQLINCSYAEKFLECIKNLTEDAKNGSIPIIHIECHGDMLDGLEFENGSDLSWESLSSALLDLNIATKFNLLVSISACYGFYFIDQMNPLKPAPTWGLVGPSEIVSPSELFDGFKIFYKSFLETLDFGYAKQSLINHSLKEGDWYCQIAEDWFIEIAQHYIANHCNRKEARLRVERLHSRLLKLGKSKKMGEIKKELIKLNRSKITEDYFDAYFSIKEIPKNKLRFASLKADLEEMMIKMRSQGYLI